MLLNFSIDICLKLYIPNILILGQTHLLFVSLICFKLISQQILYHEMATGIKRLSKLFEN